MDNRTYNRHGRIAPYRGSETIAFASNLQVNYHNTLDTAARAIIHRWAIHSTISYSFLPCLLALWLRLRSTPSTYCALLKSLVCRCATQGRQTCQAACKQKQRSWSSKGDTAGGNRLISVSSACTKHPLLGCSTMKVPKCIQASLLLALLAVSVRVDAAQEGRTLLARQDSTQLMPQVLPGQAQNEHGHHGKHGKYLHGKRAQSDKHAALSQTL